MTQTRIDTFTSKIFLINNKQLPMFFHAVTNTICPKRKYSFVYNICTLKIQEKLENEKNKALYRYM